MSRHIEKTFEVILGEAGVSVTIRPSLPFAAEEFEVANASLTLRGEGRQISLTLTQDEAEGLHAEGSIEIYEFPLQGSDPVRELIVERA